MQTLKKFHWFWAWNDEKEEAWLREMSQKGWHFKSVGFPSNYVFEQGKPTDYVYRLDYFIDRKNINDYLQLFQDADWDYLGEMGGWQYFRKEVEDGSILEIYSDKVSKAKKYERLLIYLVIFLPIYMNFINILSRSERSFMQIITVFMLILIMLYIFAMVKLLQRISELKKKV